MCQPDRDSRAEQLMEWIRTPEGREHLASLYLRLHDVGGGSQLPADMLNSSMIQAILAVEFPEQPG